MRKVLTTYESLAAQRVAAYAQHDDCIFVGVLGSLILLWMLGGKLLIG